MRARKSTSDRRRSLLAAVLVLLSLAAHSAAAGSLPSATAMLGVGVVAVAFAWAVLGRRRSFVSLMGILFAGQLLMHTITVAVGHHGVAYLPDQQMMVAHLLAAILAAVIFAHGEQIAAAWARAAGRLLGVPRLPIAEIPSQSVLPTYYRTRNFEGFDGSPCSRRGPPIVNGVPTFA